MSFLDKHEVILFQGDSVTDCGRNKQDLSDLGTGYPLIVSSILSSLYASSDFTFINKGISGNRACDLAARWTQDCIELKPTIVSILIGINDTWRKFDSNDPTSADAFEMHYDTILTRTANEINAKLILLEPFVLPVRDEQSLWREDLDPKIHIVRKLSRKYNALYIPTDGIFASAYMKKSPEFWAPDGVHPSYAGHGLIAEAWLNAIK